MAACLNLALHDHGIPQFMWRVSFSVNRMMFAGSSNPTARRSKGPSSTSILMRDDFRAYGDITPQSQATQR
jgi:hypothetical protein